MELETRRAIARALAERKKERERTDMNISTRLFRGMGIGLSLSILVWLITLSTMFIVQDAHHEKAHFLNPHHAGAYQNLAIILSVVLFLASTWISLIAGEQ